MSKQDDICNNYTLIKNNYQQLYKLLYGKLRQYGITGSSNQSFTQLIDNINNIQSAEYYYKDNVRPEDEVELPLTTEALKSISYDKYNELLAKQTNYYMRLLGYYLALKGVPIAEINNATTLLARINLIDMIQSILLTSLTVDIEDEYGLGELITVPYTIIDMNGNLVPNGKVTVTCEGTDLNAYYNGTTISFYPYRQKLDTYYFTYHGSGRYCGSRFIKNLNITEPKLKIAISIVNTSDGRYYNSIDTGYNTDLWNMTINVKNVYGRKIPNAPIKIYNNNILITEAITDNNGIYEMKDFNIPNFGTNIISVVTNYEDIENVEKNIEINIKHNLFCQQRERIVKYGTQYNYPVSILICSEEDGSSPFLGYDDTPVKITINNTETNTKITNGYINYTIDRMDAGTTKGAIYDLVLEMEFINYAKYIDDDGFDQITHTFTKTITFEIRPIIDVFNNATLNSNKNLVLSKINTVNLYQSPAKINNVIGSMSLNTENNLLIQTVPTKDIIEDSLEYAICQIDIDTNGNIQYSTVNDIYSLDN